MQDKVLSMKTVVIDATWLIRRNWSAMGKETPVHKIVESFMSSVSKIIRDYDYSRQVILCWDWGKYRYRPKTEFPEYKASREYDDSFEILWDATNILKDGLCSELGLTSLTFRGLEADDIQYYVCKTNNDNIIRSKDRDWFLSIDDNTSVEHPTDGFVDAAKLCEMYGLEHYNDYLIYKAVTGDDSDEIKGCGIEGVSVPGVISRYKSGDIPLEVKVALEHNIKLMRLDRIMTDTEVIRSLVSQQATVMEQKRPLKYLQDIFQGVHFNPALAGVLSKYNRVITRELHNDD